MSSLVLQAGLTVALAPIPFGPLIANVVGFSVGAFIDQAILFPLAFGRNKTQKIEGPKLDDRQILTGSEGSYLNYHLGIARMSGTCIWLASIEQVATNVDSGGGKGGLGGGNPTTSTTSYTYYQSLAVAFCEGPVVKLDKLWADGKLIYQKEGFRNLVLWSDVLQDDVWFRELCDVEWNVDPAPAFSGLTGDYADKIVASNINARLGQRNIRVLPNTQYTLSFWAKNGTITSPKLSVWDDTNDNQIVSPEVYTPGTGSYSRVTRLFTTPARCRKIQILPLNKCATLGADGTIYLFGVQLEQGTSATTYDRVEAVSYKQDPVYDDVSLYPGSSTQNPSPLIQAVLGVGNTPAFRDTSYMTIERLNISYFGGRIPQFTALIAKDRQETVAGAITEICSRADLVVDTSRIGAGRLRGMLTSGPQVPIKLLEQIMMVYAIFAQEINGTLYFFSRGQPLSSQYLEIPLTAMGAHMEGEMLGKVKFKRPASSQIPGEIVLNYFDYNRDFQKGSTRFTRRLKTIPGTLQLDLPFVFDEDIARLIAKRLLLQSESESLEVEFNLLPNYRKIQEGDAIKFSMHGKVYYCRILEATDGLNHIKACKATLEFSRLAASRSRSAPIDPGGTAITPYVPPDIFTVIADIAALRDTDVFTPGYYYGVCLDDASDSFRGATVYTSEDDVDFFIQGSATQQATLGLTTDVLGVGAEDAWDAVSTVTVVLKNGTLQSLTATQVLNGNNWILIGDEIVGFQTATLTATNTYELSDLRRGLRGTQAAIATHAIDEKVMLLNGAVRFVPVNFAQVGQERTYRSVPFNGDLDAYGEADYTLTLAANTVKPQPVKNIIGSFDGGFNLTIDWDRITRAVVATASPVNTTQLADELNNYQIDVHPDAVSVTVLATKTVNAARTYVYSAAAQTTDTLTPGAPVNITIYQMSSVVGRGIGRRITLTP